MNRNVFTGAKAVVTINGKTVTFAKDVTYGQYAFLTDFDIKWSNKYAIKCEEMCKRFDRVDTGYKVVYDLCHLLWKLKVLKL